MTNIFVAMSQAPKREFRGAWLHTVFQGQYARQTTAENQAYLRNVLDSLKMAGINAIIFQVRPQSDAFYKSALEPWSQFLSGTSGKAPNPEWDPLEFIIAESHARGMELHAWLNPYRASTSKTDKFPRSHIYSKHPERFVTYDGKIYFDPGIPENRKFICKVVKDIVTRYDVDAIHMDDYFYPYPSGKKAFPDSKSYKRYGKKKDIGDWRRENVNRLIEELHRTITEAKPWVRLGISPFGIWRNKSSDPRGSDTNGLQNYDALYADVLLWTKNGWVDYMMPQLYWELEHKAASTQVLAAWWNANANGRHMYFGQSIKTTMDKADTAPTGNPTQLDHKIRLSRSLQNVQGNCWWPGYEIVNNYKGIADSLAQHQQRAMALVPSYPWIDSIAPEEVKSLKLAKSDGHRQLKWKRRSTSDKMQEQKAFVVYRFAKGTKADIGDASAIVAVTYGTEYRIPDNQHGTFTYTVTALDRANNESRKGESITVDL